MVDTPAGRARQDFGAFCTYMDPTYQNAKHTKIIRAALEEVERGDISRLIVTMPPRHGKSRHCSEFFPAWLLGRDPTAEIIIASHTDSLAEAKSREVQNFFSNPRWPFPSSRIDYKIRGVGRWQTTEGGQLLACGIQGGATGFGADYLVIDDYLKTREQADSAAIRDKCWDFFTETGRTRLSPNGAIVILATRWHEDDLIGRILSGPGASRWKVIELRAVCDDDNDPLNRKQGEALWPERFSLDKLPSLEANEIDIRGWEALYQQRPTAAVGNIFHREWWQYYDPRVTTLQGLNPMFISVDSSFKEGISNDFSVAAVWGRMNGKAYLLDLWRARVQFPELVESLKALYTKWHVPLVIEDKASGQSAIQVLSRAHIPIIPHKIPSSSTKISRAEPLALYVESGMVYIPMDAEWRNDFIEEHASFPNSAHDDQVDTTSMALPRLLMGLQRRDPRDLAYNSNIVGARPKSRWLTNLREQRQRDAEERYKEMFGE